MIRSERNVETLAVPIQKIIGEMDRDLPVGNVMTLRETIGRSTIDSQFDSILVLAFAGHRAAAGRCRVYGGWRPGDPTHQRDWHSDRARRAARPCAAPHAA